MAIPDDPHFTAAKLAELNAAFRFLGFSKKARQEIAAYINDGTTTERSVARWLAPAWEAGEASKYATPAAEGAVTKRDLLRSLERYSREELHRGAAFLGLEFAQKWNRAQLVAGMTAGLNKWQIGAIMDHLRPQLAQQEAAIPATFLGSYLSDYARGTPDRRRLDVVLALLGEVKQSPEVGSNPQTFKKNWSSIADAEDAMIWKLRYGSWPNVFIKEGWAKIVLTRDSSGWVVTVTFFVDVSEEGFGDFEDTGEGWPVRDSWKEARERHQAELVRLAKERKKHKPKKKGRRQ